MKLYRKILLAYFVIGIAWAPVSGYKSIECYNKISGTGHPAHAIVVTNTMIVNAVLWPAAIPMGIMAWDCKL